MDTRKILEALTTNPAAAGAVGGLAGSLLGGVLGGGKIRMGGLVKAGGLAAVGYLAYQAWQRHQAQKTGQAATTAGTTYAPGAPALPASVPPAFSLDTATRSAAALRVIKAMVAAAKADGVVEPAERGRIVERIRQSTLPPEDQAEVTHILLEPLNIDEVVGGVDSAELAAEIYAASLLAVLPANRAERAYLDMLAARLNLEPGLVAELERGAAQAVPVA